MKLPFYNYGGYPRGYSWVLLFPSLQHTAELAAVGVVQSCGPAVAAAVVVAAVIVATRAAAAAAVDTTYTRDWHEFQDNNDNLTICIEC